MSESSRLQKKRQRREKRAQSAPARRPAPSQLERAQLRVDAARAKQLATIQEYRRVSATVTEFEHPLMDAAVDVAEHLLRTEEDIELYAAAFELSDVAAKFELAEQQAVADANRTALGGQLEEMAGHATRAGMPKVAEAARVAAKIYASDGATVDERKSAVAAVAASIRARMN